MSIILVPSIRCDKVCFSFPKGTLPLELAEVALKELSLGDNRLGGTLSALDEAAVAPGLAVLVPNLVDLRLQRNAFEGALPASLIQIFQLFRM